MSIPEDALKKILSQIQTQAVTSQRSLQVVKAQIAAKEKERKILQLTTRELSTVPQDANMYRGVGKMFVQEDRSDIDRRHQSQEKSLDEEITSLGKKSKYLEKQFDEANSQLKDIFHAQRREQ